MWKARAETRGDKSVQTQGRLGMPFSNPIYAPALICGGGSKGRPSADLTTQARQTYCASFCVYLHPIVIYFLFMILLLNVLLYVCNCVKYIYIVVLHVLKIRKLLNF